MNTIQERLDAANKRIAELEAALREADAAIWDAHYGGGISRSYAQDVSRSISRALAAAPESAPAKEAERER